MKPTSFVTAAVLVLGLAACDRHRSSQTTTTSGTTTSQDGTSTGTTGVVGPGAAAVGPGATANPGARANAPKSEPTASDFGRDAGGLGSGTRIETGTTNIGVGHGGALDGTNQRSTDQGTPHTSTDR